MKRTVISIIVLAVMTLACSFGGLLGGKETTDQAAVPETSAPQSPQSEHRCGDDICDGPENIENCPEDCENIVIIQEHRDETPASGYRKVSLSGSITVSPNPEKMDDFVGKASEYNGEYTIELWFPLDGGQAVQQRNTVALTDLHFLYYGDLDCVPCETKLDEQALEPVPFELDATLTLNEGTKNGQPADELVYQVAEVPAVTVTVSSICSCPGNQWGDYSDPAAYQTMLYYWFLQEHIRLIQLDMTETDSVENFSTTPSSVVTIPLETLTYTIVPSMEP